MRCDSNETYSLSQFDRLPTSVALEYLTNQAKRFNLIDRAQLASCRNCSSRIARFSNLSLSRKQMDGAFLRTPHLEKNGALPDDQ